MSEHVIVSPEDNPPAPKPEAMYQQIQLTLSNGRAGVFVGPVLAQPAELRLALQTIRVSQCVFGAPQPLPPRASVPMLLEKLRVWAETKATFEADFKPENADAYVKASEELESFLIECALLGDAPGGH